MLDLHIGIKVSAIWITPFTARLSLVTYTVRKFPQTQAKSQNAEFANYPSERIFASQLSIVTPRARYQLENESINVPIELLST